MRLIDRFSRRYWEGEASGAAVFMTSYGASDREQVLPQMAAFARAAYKDNSVVSGAILRRLALFSEATFGFKDRSDGHLFGAEETDGRRPSLRKLEQPWPNGTTGELLARMLLDADIAGNSYIWDAGPHLVRRRPDQVTIVSEEKADREGRVYREVIGFYWDPAPFNTGQPSPKAQFYTVDEVAHWAPIPDPDADFKGMSWMSAVMREVNADTALTQYKQKYLDHAATPNLLLKYKQKLRDDTKDALTERIQARYGGVDNAFKTLVLDEGADHAVVGNSLDQMNFTSVQAAGVERICMNSGVSRRLLGLPDDSGVTFSEAMRSFADLTMRPLWRSACASLSQLVAVPSGAKLWFDTRDIAALQDAETERAQVTQVHAAAILTLVQAGFTRVSARETVGSGDVTKLVPDPNAPPPGVSGRETATEKFGSPPGGPQATLTKPQTAASKVPMPASFPTPALPGTPVSNPATANGRK